MIEYYYEQTRSFISRKIQDNFCNEVKFVKYDTFRKRVNKDGSIKNAKAEYQEKIGLHQMTYRLENTLKIQCKLKNTFQFNSYLMWMKLILTNCPIQKKDLSLLQKF